MSPRPGPSRIAVAGVAATGLAVGIASLLPAHAGASTAAASAAIARTAVAPHVSTSKQWSVSLGANRPIALSSPTVATLDGDGPSVIVGDRAGYLDAYHLRDGSAVPGWPVKVGAPIDSTPSVAKSGSAAVVFVGAGNAGAPAVGGYFAYRASGALLWHRVAAQTPSAGSAPSGVQASLTVGTLQGAYDVVAGDLGQEMYEMQGGSGAVRSGFPWFQADSQFSTAAIAEVGDGGHDIIVGGASTAGNAFNHQYGNGGHIRILAAGGHGSSTNPAAGLVCELVTNQEVDSSPAVGRFLAGGAVGIVSGTGTYYSGASQTDYLIAMNPHCGVAWHDKLDGGTGSSPALVDALGNGGLQVAQTTQTGTVYLINGGTGKGIWHTQLPGQIFGSPSSVDLGGGYQDVVVGTTSGVYILDGRTGSVVTTVETGVGTQNTPLVTADANGTVGITVAGYGSGNVGSITHYEIAGSAGSRVAEAGSWPQFHHDPQLTGVGTTPVVKPAPPNPADLVRTAGVPGATPVLRRPGR